MNDDLIEFHEAPRSNFTMIPNSVDDMNLDPYAFRLYCHLRRVAGEQGACWQSTATLAKACHMSTGQVSKSKKALVEAKLIVVTERAAPGGVQHVITIKDIWQRNAVHAMNAQSGQRSHSEGQRSLCEGQPSHSETKNNPLRRTNEEDVGAQTLTGEQSSMSAPTTPGNPSATKKTSSSVELTPQTDEEREFFRLAAMNATGRPPRARFQNAQQASDFRAAVVVLNGETVRVLEAFYRGGGGEIGKAVSYVCGAARRRQAQPQPASEYQPPMFFAPTSWEE